jgi:cell division septation protein DedD
MSPRLDVEPDDRQEIQDDPPSRNHQALRAVLLAIVVAGLAGGSWWAGHGGKPATQDVSAVPEIHPDAAPVKEAPKDPGGMVVPGQDSVLLNHDAKGKPEELLPPPEAAKARPAPPPQVAATPSPPAAPPVATGAEPAPEPSPAPTAASPPPQIAAAPATPTSPGAGPTPKMAPAPGVAGPAYRLQLGALKSEAAAKAEWQKLQRQQPDVLGKLSLTVSRVDLGAKGVYYRIQAGPVADAGQAAQDCAALKSRNIGCILVKP